MITPLIALNNPRSNTIVWTASFWMQSAWFISWVILPAGSALKRAVLSSWCHPTDTRHVPSYCLKVRFDLSNHLGRGPR